MLNAYVWTQIWIDRRREQLRQWMEDEGGLEVVEYVAMILLAMVLITVVAGYIGDNGKDRLGSAFVERLAKWLEGMGESQN